MSLEDEIKTLLVAGNAVTITLRYPRVDYTGVVETVEGGEFVLRGELLNPQEHFSNLSADPIYRIHKLGIADIAAIRSP